MERKKENLVEHCCSGLDFEVIIIHYHWCYYRNSFEI